MSLRVIHTGDLHIGQKLKKNSRHEEHTLLLSWLHSVIDAEKAQVLLIAGDIFDCSTPAPKSQHLFNRFLASLESITSLLSVIITAGNHDSAQRLEAMKPVLARIGIHIVGAHENRSAKWDDWLIPIRDHNRDVQAVVAAVPFVHEFRLGLKKGVGNKEQYSDRIKASFSDLYTHFARRSEEQYPGVPLIGMGHLTAISEEELVGPAPQNVHMALEKGMDGRIFDSRYCYVALGHIHKNYRIRGDANAYYCGSPLPCSIDEAEDRTRRGVWCLDVSDVHTKPTPRLIKAPIFRHLLRLCGSVEEVQAALLDHTWEDGQEPSFVWIKAETKVPRYDLHDVFGSTLKALDAEKRPYIVSVDNVIPELIGKKEAIPVDIRTTPVEVFALLLKEKGLDPKQPNLQNLFAYVLSQLGEHGVTPNRSSNALEPRAAEKSEENPKTFRVPEQVSDTLVRSTESDAQNRGIHEIS